VPRAPVLIYSYLMCSQANRAEYVSQGTGNTSVFYGPKPTLSCFPRYWEHPSVLLPEANTELFPLPKEKSF